MKRKILIFSAIFAGLHISSCYASDTLDNEDFETKAASSAAVVPVVYQAVPVGHQVVEVSLKGYTRLDSSMDVSECEAIYDLRETKHNRYSKVCEVWRIHDPKVEREGEVFYSLMAHSCNISTKGVLVTHLEFPLGDRYGLRALNSLLMHLTGISHLRGTRYNQIAIWVPKVEHEGSKDLTASYLWLTGNFKFIERQRPFADLASCQPLIPSQGKVQLFAESNELRKRIVVKQGLDYLK